MRTLLWIAMVVALAAPPAWSGEPPAKGDNGGRRPGGRQRGGNQGGPGGAMRGAMAGRMLGQMGGMLGAQQAATEIFDAATKTLQLTDEAKAGVDLLSAQYADELEAAMTELRMKMNKDYVAKILALVPDDQKPKYEAVAKALAARDEALAAARKELKAVLATVKKNQGADKAPAADNRRPRFGPPGGATDTKVEVLRTHFVLTEAQQEGLDTAQRNGFGGMRDRMQGLFAGLRGAGGPPDPNAFRQIGEAMRKVRNEIDDEVAKVAAALLSEEQKKDYTTACAAVDASRKKEKEAEEACRKAIVEAVGEAKANALLGAPAGQAAAPVPATAF